MACISEYIANGTAIAKTAMGASTEAIANALLDGSLACALTGSCSGLNEQCSFTALSGSGSITQIATARTLDARAA